MEEAGYNCAELDRLEAKFHTIVKAVEKDLNEDGKIDSIILDDGIEKSVIPYEIWRAGNFNMLDQRIDRDDTQKVENNSQLIERFNSYQFEDRTIEGSWVGTCFGYVMVAVTCGGWIFTRRRTIPPGTFPSQKCNPNMKVLMMRLSTGWI